jgi:tetratricopeptide (TPR) repeat protein
VLQLDPNHAAAHYGLAKSYLGQKDLQRAYWELQESARLDPTNVDARLQYAEFLLLGKQEELEEAIKQADEVGAKDPERLALLLKGRACNPGALRGARRSTSRPPRRPRSRRRSCCSPRCTARAASRSAPRRCSASSSR